MTQLVLALPLPAADYLAACKRLSRMVRKKRNSYEIRRYRERRAAALKGLSR